MTLNLHEDGVVMCKQGVGLCHDDLSVCHPLNKGYMGSRKRCQRG